MTEKELKEILGRHRKWLSKEEGGERADLRCANLRCADLGGADLCGANLFGANLFGVKYDETTAFFALTCPEEGAFIGFKKAGGKIVKLLIPEDAKRSSATSRKCRCSKATVLSITNLDGSDEGDKSVKSDCRKYLIYKVGKTLEVKDFDENRWYPYTFKNATQEELELAVDTWQEALSGYSEELVKYAFKEAIKACKMPPTIADVIEQIERVRVARDKSDGELWNEYLNLIYLAKDMAGRFHYTAKEEGKTQGERAREELQAAFEGADERIKDFLGSVGNLVDVCKTDDLRQEKERFYWGIKNCRKRIKAKAEIPAVFLEAAKEVKRIE